MAQEFNEVTETEALAAPVAVPTGVCLDQERVPLDAYWPVLDDAPLRFGRALFPFTVRVTTREVVVTLPLPPAGISIGKAETCDVQVATEALVPYELSIVPEERYARIRLSRGCDFCTVWHHSHPVFDGDKMWRGDVIDLEGMRVELF